MSERRRDSRARATVAALVVLASCGYAPVKSRLPDGAEAVHIPLVGNETAFPDIAGALTKALRIRTQESGLRVVARSGGVHRLRATIVAVNGAPGMLTADGDRLKPLDTIWQVTVEARLEDADGRVVKGPERFEAAGRAYSGPNPVSEEAIGHERRLALEDDIANMIVRYMFQQ
jgi:hypothetical protein